MHLETKKENGIVIVKPLSESINAAVSTEFKGSLIDIINQGSNFVLLNLSKVGFIDSSGLGAFISILKTIELNNGKVVICEMTPPILNLFKLTRLDRVFTIASNETEGCTILKTKKQ